MLARPTTFILGAGASHELKLPTGDTLQSQIAKMLLDISPQGSFETNKIWHALLRSSRSISHQGSINRYFEAARKIREAMPVAASIDNFLHTHQDDPDIVIIGKMSIALLIIESEARLISSLPKSDPDHEILIDSDIYRSSWYHPFIKMITMGATNSDPSRAFENISFIVFNYDRCLELVLIQSIQRYYCLSEKDASDIVGGVPIIHPYGSLGRLTSSDGSGVPFGYTNADLISIAQRLKTFTESVESHVADKIHTAMSEAETLVFLGFGFLPQNMELIAPRGYGHANRIHATTHGFSITDKMVIEKQLERFLPSAIHFDLAKIESVNVAAKRNGYVDVNNSTCRDLIDSHRIRLSTT